MKEITYCPDVIFNLKKMITSEDESSRMLGWNILKNNFNEIVYPLNCVFTSFNLWGYYFGSRLNHEGLWAYSFENNIWYTEAEWELQNHNLTSGNKKIGYFDFSGDSTDTYITKEYPDRYSDLNLIYTFLFFWGFDESNHIVLYNPPHDIIELFFPNVCYENVRHYCRCRFFDGTFWIYLSIRRVPISIPNSHKYEIDLVLTREIFNGTCI